MRPDILRALGALLRDRRGNVTLVSALVLPALLGVAGLAVEFGSALNQKTQDQKVADAAAFAAATVYNTNNAASLSSVAQQIATLNGLPGSAISSVGIVSSPTGSGNSAVKVVVATTTPLVLSKAIAPSLASLDISATAYAEIKGGAPACILALKPSGTGVTLSGGTQLTANACAVESNNTVTVPCGTTITTVALYYNSSSTPSQPCNGIAAPAGKTLTMKKAASTDPIAGTSVLTAATSDISNTQNLASPAAPAAVAGTAIKFDYSAASSKTWPTGCSGTNNSGAWTVTCTGNGPFNFGAITMQGGTTLAINTSSATNPVFNFTSLDLVGTDTFAAGTYNVAQGVKTEGGSTVTFAAGTFNFGTGLCGSGVSLCHTGTTVTFGGPSSFTFSGGITVGGGATLAMGAGSTNTYYLGKATDGNSFYSSGGAKVTFADATGSTFKMAGNFDNAGGGACTYIAAADKHQINGYFKAAGGITAGAGLYTVNGYMALGASGGGDVTCNGQTVGVMAQDVTFVLTAATTPSSGCTGLAFCVGAGYGHVTIAAASSGSYAKMAVVGPVSGSSAAGATIAEGASSTTISGAFYFPQGAVSLSGAGNLGSGAGHCLTVVGTQISLSGGSALATACVTGSGSNNGGQVVLVG